MPDLLFLISGLVLLILGAELLAQGGARLARRMGVSPLIIGTTIVAYGTSAPELALGIRAGLAGHDDLVAGVIFGGNIFNILFVLGVSALVSPLKVTYRLVRLDVPLMIVATGLAWLFCSDGRVGLLESAFLLVLLPVYTVFTIYYVRRVPLEQSRPQPMDTSERRPKRSKILEAPFILGGVVLLVMGARLLVEGVTGAAAWSGIDELTLGLIAVGAVVCLPELVTSLSANIRGERNIAVGNVVASVMFNLLGVLSVAGFCSGGLSVESLVRELDLPAVFAAGVVCLPIFLTGAVISRTEGGFFILFYLLYVVLVLLRAVSSPVYEVLADGFFYILLPCTGLGVVLGLWYAYYELKVLTADITDDISVFANAIIGNARKAVVTVIGTTLILGGIAMMVLPGPATIVIPLGLAILSTEFIWARRLLNYVKKEVEHAVKRISGKDEEKQE